MDASQFDQLQRDLVDRGLPLSYVRRLRRELADHLADQPVGQPNQLVDDTSFHDFVVHQYRSARTAGKHPWLVFVLAPIPVAVVLCTLFHAIAIVGFCLFAPDLDDLPDWGGQSVFEIYPVASRAFCACFVVGKWLPLFATTYLFARWHRASGRVSSWLAATVMILVAFGAVGYMSELELPTAETREGGIGLRAFSITATSDLAFQFLQSVAPLTLFCFQVRRWVPRFAEPDVCLEC